ncbi:MAG TPA: CHC2 zinc finger domain-containing protein [Pyrinomonadaceae bacterium]|nr:CHC2 zinc finger domain-containing protein [Pyrinomonadaceae bacterium]
MKNIFDDIKSRTNIVHIALGLGITLKRKGSEWFGNCPFGNHSDKTGSFTVGGKKNPTKFFCFGCGAKGDVFDLVEQKLGYSKFDALSYLADVTGLQLPADQFYPQIKPKDQRLTTSKTQNKPDLNPQFSEGQQNYQPDLNLLDECYRALLEKLELTGWAAQNLQKRGAKISEFQRLSYRSFPTDRNQRIEIAETLADKFGLSETRRVPGFFQLENNKWCWGGNKNGDRSLRVRIKNKDLSLVPPALIIPSYSAEGKIQSLKLRNPDFPYQLVGLTPSESLIAKEKDPKLHQEIQTALNYYPAKYMVLSSSNYKNGIGANLGLHYSQLNPYQKKMSVILTEGELKADLISQFTSVPVVALPGVNLRHERIVSEMLLMNESKLISDKLQENFHNLPELKMKQKFELATFALRLKADQLKPNYEFGNSLLIAFDNETSAAVLQSLVKMTIIAKAFSSFQFNFLFWRKFKGFDDFLANSQDEIFLLELQKIWE